MTAPTIEEFGRRLRARGVTALEIVEQCLDRIELENPRLNAFILVTADEARRQAREADRELASGHDRGPLHGVPISIKDILDIQGLPTTAASRVREGHRATSDAPAITTLRQAGAVFVGKTNLHEFAFGTTSDDSAYGPARNPHDPTRSPGGSSGGSAASVAAGMALASIGTDTGGSIRIPAAACGVVGLKPTYGEISTRGVVPLSRSFDHVGPLTKTVTDAWLVYNALLGVRTPHSLAVAPLEGLQFAVLRPYFCDLLDDEVRKLFEEALAALRSANARIVEAEIAHAAEIAPGYAHVSLTEAATYHARTLDEKPELYTQPVRLRLEMGRYILAEDYVRASLGREVLRREVDRALEGCEALLLPTLPIPAPLIGAATIRIGSVDESVRAAMLRLTQLFNMTGHPAVSIPCGTTAAGLPCGLQLVGRRAETAAVVRVALACERALAERVERP
jgi:aspartyl-tRNA(Asn)/glutamyl-tRNA(Gln) amidotransferase subunit A